MKPSPRDAAVGAICVALLGVTIWGGPASVPDPQPGSPPDPAELDSLSVYLRPVSPAPRLDDYVVFLPAAPRPLPEVAEAPAAPVDTDGWRVSAILVAGNRTVAIINDETVVVGSRLEDGAEVVAIEKDHVVLRAPGGTRRILWLSAE